MINTLRKMPDRQREMEGDAIRYHKNVNLGIAVALDWGLIVPVINEAEDKSFWGSLGQSWISPSAHVERG